MGLAEIVQRIAADAELESDRIVSEARERAAEIAAHADEDGAAVTEAVLSEAKARAARDRAHTLAQARLEARNQVLAEKRVALDEAEGDARERLSKMSDDRYRNVLATAVAARARGDEKVAFDRADARRMGKDFLDHANRALERAGRPGRLTEADESTDLGGAGLVLIGDGFEDRITPSSLMAEARAELEPEIARALFPEGDGT